MINILIAFAFILGVAFSSIYIDYKLGFFQKAKNLLRAIKWLFFKPTKKSYPGILSPLQSFNIALAGTVGIGNITGIIFAITIGGPGTVFWIWISAFLGMIFKFASSFICFKYRVIHMDRVFGGIMYIYRYQLKSPFIGHMTAFLILFTALYTGNFIQSGQVMEGFKLSIPDILIDNYWTISFFFCLSMALVIANGLRYISLICSIISPFMIVFYIVICLVVIFFHINQFIPIVWKIFYSAFSIESFTSGTAAYLWILAIKEGILSGLFSSESAFGSSSFAHILAKSKNSFRQAMISVLEVVIDTFVICSLTAFVFLITNTNGIDKKPIKMMIESIDKGFFFFGPYSLMISSFLVGFVMILFAYSTIIAWAYYGEQVILYFFQNDNNKMKWGIRVYRFIYVIISFIGTLTQFNLLFFNNIFHYMSFLIIIPHLISLIILVPKIKESSDFQFEISKK